MEDFKRSLSVDFKCLKPLKNNLKSVRMKTNLEMFTNVGMMDLQQKIGREIHLRALFRRHIYMSKLQNEIFTCQLSVKLILNPVELNKTKPSAVLTVENMAATRKARETCKFINKR